MSLLDKEKKPRSSKDLPFRNYAVLETTADPVSKRSEPQILLSTCNYPLTVFYSTVMPAVKPNLK